MSLKHLTPSDRVTWTRRDTLEGLLGDIDSAHARQQITASEATELRHDICATWAILFH